MNTHDGYGQAKSKDLVYWESQKYPQVTSDFEGTRVKVTIDGQEQTGNINRVSWTLVDKLTKHYERTNTGMFCTQNVRYKIKSVLPG